MKVKEIMTKKVITARSDTPIAIIAELLWKNHFTGLPVVDNNLKVLGIVTEYDLLSRGEHIHIPSYIKFLKQFKAGKTGEAKQEVKRIQSLLAKDIMTAPVVTVTPDTTVAESARIFSEKRINPLPVVNQAGKLTGIIARSDVIKLFSQSNQVSSS